MLTFADARVFLNPAPVAPRQPVLPVALVGHVPGAARPERLSRALREPWHGLGLQPREQQLDRALANGPAGDDDDTLLALHHLPLALDSHAQFLDLFPDAGTAATGPAAPVGAAPWLPLAIEDFFAAGGERLWLVRVPQSEGRDGLLPAQPGDPARPDTLRGLDVALNVPDIGLVALPDLERLQLPAGLDPLPDFTPAPAQARFVPVDELARADAVPTPPPSPLSPPWPLAEVVRRLCARFEAWRPDVQALLTLPLTATLDGGAQPDAAALAWLAALDGEELRRAQRLQPLYPYLRGRRAPLASATGLVAGTIAASAFRDGPWRSVAGRDLGGDALPWPVQTPRSAAQLRRSPGVGVLLARDGRLVLDDERLPGGLPDTRAEQPGLPQPPARTAYYRSAEVLRFVNWLLRRLDALGQRLVFVSDPDDPRPALLLEDFFARLHALGALRGARFEDACTIRRAAAGAAALAFEIEIAPAVPVDAITLTLAPVDGDWRAQAVAGRG